MKSMMFSKQCFRLFSTVPAKVDKALLSKLRKSTGYAMKNCKEALLENNQDLKQATAWLAQQAQSQGWAKAEKLAGRNVTQGLLGVSVSGDRKSASIFECKCETDFVARNSEFIDMVGDITQKLLEDTASNKMEDGIGKLTCSLEALSQTKYEGDMTVADRLALTIGKCGENMALGRSLRMSCGGDLSLYGTTHGAGRSTLPLTDTPMTGTYAALVAVRGALEPATAKSLCLQIIGMSPKFVGTPQEIEKFQKEAAEAAQKSQKKEPSAVDEANPEESLLEEQQDKQPKDDYLSLQAWMADDSMTVAEVAEENNFEVVDFVRFKLAEEESS